MKSYRRLVAASQKKQVELLDASLIVAFSPTIF